MHGMVSISMLSKFVIVVFAVFKATPLSEGRVHTEPILGQSARSHTRSCALRLHDGGNRKGWKLKCGQGKPSDRFGGRFEGFAFSHVKGQTGDELGRLLRRAEAVVRKSKEAAPTNTKPFVRCLCTGYSARGGRQPHKRRHSTGFGAAAG